MHITAQGPYLRNDYTVSSGTLNSTIPCYTILCSEQIKTLNIWYTTGISQVVANTW